MKPLLTFPLLLTATLLLAQKPRLVMPVGHTGYAYSVAYSPNGKYILTGNLDFSAKLWDLNGKELLHFNTDGEVYSAVFSPACPDDPDGGRYVLLGSTDHSATLWNMAGEKIRTFSGHTQEVKSVAFSPDGRMVLTGSTDGYLPGSRDGQLILWSLDGNKIGEFIGMEDAGYNSVAFSPACPADPGGGKFVLTAGRDGIARLYDLDGNPAQPIGDDSSGDIYSAVFSPNGQNILTGHSDKTARLWDLSGNLVQSFIGHSKQVRSVAFSPDGESVLTGSFDNTAKLWDLHGNLIRTFDGNKDAIWSVAFSPAEGGQSILTGCGDNKITMWDLAGNEIQSFNGHANPIKFVAFAPEDKKAAGNGYHLLTGGFDGNVCRWNIADRSVQTFKTDGDGYYAPFASDGKSVLTSNKQHSATRWDFMGKEMQSFSGHSETVCALAFSPDGKSVLTGSTDNTAKLWDLEGNCTQTFSGHRAGVHTVAFSPACPADPGGGKFVLTGTQDSTAILWDIQGNKIKTFFCNAWVNYVGFSPDGKSVLTVSEQTNITLWDLAGKPLHNFKPESIYVMDVAFSPATPDDPSGGKYLLIGYFEGKVVLCDVKGNIIRVFQGSNTLRNRSVNFSPDGKFILSGGDDNVTKLWDLASGKELAALVSTGTNDWVVTTPSGLFDASPGAMKLMHYMVGLEVIELKQLKARYYEPYLLQKIMGYVPGGLRPVDGLNDVPLYPELLEAKIQNDILRVRLKPRSGGIGKVALELDDFELLADANPMRQADFQLDLKPFLEFFLPDMPNNLSLKLYNEKGWLESQSYVLEHTYDGVAARDPNNPDQPRKSLNDRTDANLEKIHLYALVVGTSKYREEKLNLKYPEKDAAMFADALRKAGGKLFKERVEVQVLSTEVEPWPRKATIRNALLNIKAKATPHDILLVYFSGHGITYPPISEDGQFYYLTTDIEGDKLKDEAILKTQAIAQDSLMHWVRQIKARKRILIYDACNSGSVVKNFEEGAKDLNTDQRRALERMKDRTGMYVLAGSAADKSSYEASNFGHGLLTYSLINGMLKVAAKNNGDVELGDLFAFVEDDVERLAKDINREQRPEVIKAKSYPIGIIDKDTDIKMPIELPIFVQTGFTYSKRGKDLLDVSTAFNSALNKLSAEKKPSLAFWDIASFSGKHYYLGGEYQEDGGIITGTVFLYQGNKELNTFPLSGSKNDLSKIAENILFDVQGYLAKNPPK